MLPVGPPYNAIMPGIAAAPSAEVRDILESTAGRWKNTFTT
jgi:hypothetical protein